MKKWYIILAVLMVILLAISCGPSTPLPEITDDQKAQAVQAMKDEPGVIDAAIHQEGKDLSLAIMVEFDISEIRAKLLAEKFINMVMLYDPEESPVEGGKWEEGIFDYLVTVINPNEEVMDQGAKVSFADHITW